MKKFFAISACVCIAMAVTSCKSKESAYKAAYEQAMAQNAALQQQQQQQQTVVETPVVTPVVTTPATETRVTSNTNDNVAVRSEGLSVVDGRALRAYSVVVGSYGVRANADRVAASLRAQGYDARIALNSERGLYRVVASSFDTKGEAIASRDRLDVEYPGAWLLYQK